MSFTEDLSIEYHRIDQQLTELYDRIAPLPEGDLICRVNGKWHKWFRIMNVHPRLDHRGRPHHQYIYIPKSQTDLARKLALRKYYLAKAEDLKQRKAALNELLQNIEQNCHHAEGVLGQEGMAELLTPVVEEKDEVIESWLREDYPRNPNYPDKLVVPTICGFCVRSKSEALIANLLYTRSIPFRYECRLTLGDYNYYPDFTILHPKTHQTIIWEHFGMMSTQTYQSEYAAKLGRYAANGFIPYINFISTFETKEMPFDSAAANHIMRLMFE